MRCFYFLLIASLLSACQSSNPYRPQSQPMPPAPAAATEHIDVSGYPAEPRHYGQYQSWNWFQGKVPNELAWLGSEQLSDIVSAQLDQVGLRPAVGSAGQLLVKASVRQHTRIEQQRDYVGGYYGQPPWNRHYGLGAHIPITRAVERQVLLVQIDLIDATERVTVWSGQGQAPLSSEPAAQNAALRTAIAAALSGYPPY